MTTSPHNPHTRRIRRGPSVLLLLGTLACALIVALPGGHATSSRSSREALRAGATDSDELDGRDPRLMDSKRPKVEASFPAESYGPGSKARLVFVSSAKGVTLQFFRAGTEAKRITASDVMLGSSVSPPSRLGKVWPRRTVPVRIGNWSSGLYFARLTASGGRVGFAPYELPGSEALGMHVGELPAERAHTVAERIGEDVEGAQDAEGVAVGVEEGAAGVTGDARGDGVHALGPAAVGAALADTELRAQR